MCLARGLLSWVMPATGPSTWVTVPPRGGNGGAAEARTGVTTGFAGHNSYLTEINPEIFLQTEPGATLPQMTKICPKMRLKLAQNLTDSQCF